jgi:hypothetical protein
MNEPHHRSCKCGAVYSRIEAMAPSRQIASFECLLCGATLETWEYGMGANFSARRRPPVRISDLHNAGGCRE